MAKTLAADEADGENIGIAKFGAAGAAVLVDVMHADLWYAGGVRDWLPRAFAAFAGVRPLHVVDRRGVPVDRDRFSRGLLAGVHRRAALDTDGDGRRAPAREAAQAACGASGRTCTMYERFYNLRERPFSLSPDPDYLYPSRVHTEALSYLRYGIEGHAGFVVITGEIGSGKTTLLQTALRSLDQQTSVARLVNTVLDARELIEAVMLDFGLEPRPGAASRTCCAIWRASSSSSGARVGSRCWSSTRRRT